MKKSIKIGLYLMGAVLFVILCGLTYIKSALPDVGTPDDISVELTPARLERGQYLANNVMVCMDCHSTRDWTKFSGPVVSGTLGKGGERFDQKVDMPGTIYSRNITPSGISRYSDGELFRLITTGVTKEGRAMFPLMPYQYYGRLDREDIFSVIAYVRSLDPIENSVPDSKLDFPMNFIINTIPQKAELKSRPDPVDLIAYGSYIVQAAACEECHTQADKGQIIKELSFGGGREFKFPDGSIVRSMNITPDKTGIGAWTEEVFIKRFKMYADSSYVPHSVATGEFNSMMPWTMYAQMKEEDLKAVFVYLKTLKPIKNTVERFTPAQ